MYLIERLHPGPGDQGGAWLVESDVSVGPNAADEELYATCFLYFPFIFVALRFEVGGVAVQQVGIFWLIVGFTTRCWEQCYVFPLLRMRKAVHT